MRRTKTSPPEAAQTASRTRKPPSSDCTKQCSCGESFSRKDLLESRAISPVGMLHLAGDPAETAIYCFTHTRWSCRTTFALPVVAFRDDIQESIPSPCLEGTDACGGHCARIEDLQSCNNECALAPYRRFLLERLVRRR